MLNRRGNENIELIKIAYQIYEIKETEDDRKLS